MRTLDDIRALIAQLDGKTAEDIESEVVEFKSWESDVRTLHRVLRETTVCLANSRGGTIVLGVRDGCRTRRSAIQGVGRSDPAELRRAIYDGTDPHILVEVDVLNEPEGTLLVVHVPRGMPPHTTSDGVAKIRIGKNCQPLTGRTFSQLLAAGGQRDPTAEAMLGTALRDIDPTAMVEIRAVLSRDSQNASLATQDDDELLSSLGLKVAEGLTMAGLLLAGRPESLARLVPQHEVTFLRHRSQTRYDQRRDLRGPLVSVLREMEQLVSTHNRVKTIQEEGLGQIEFPDLAWEVARESVLNAVTHRDYFVRQGVIVALHRDRLEVSSPGGFIGGITPENILRHPPVHRNELLARALQTLGLVNRVGAGVDRIFHELLRQGKGPPRFSGDESHVLLSIPIETDEEFARLVVGEDRRGRALELDDLLVLWDLMGAASLDRWSAARLLQRPEEEAAGRLALLRQRGYLVAWGRGRSASYGLRRDLATRLRGRMAAETEAPLEEAAVRLRLLALLDERKRLSNAEIRRFSGFSRIQVYRLVKVLEAEGLVRLKGHGRGAHIVARKGGESEPPRK